MTKITWRGEDDGPPSCVWNGITFPAGLAVEVADQWMIAKARGNRFFEVEDYDPFLDRPTQWREPDTEADPKDQLVPAQAGVSFFDDPPGVETPLDDEPKRKSGRPRKVTADGQ